MAIVRSRRTITRDGASAVIDAAESHANANGYRVVIAVVDPSGELVELRRTSGAQVASSRVAVDKARTAAIFVRPSREIEEQVSGGRLGALALHGAAALIGGVPLTVDGEVVGAVGASGETPDEDESVSLAGAATSFDTETVFDISYDGARLAAEASIDAAGARGVAPVAAVVDAGGDLVYLARPDAAQVASVGVSIDKARTAAIYRRPSKDFEDQASGGRPSALHLARSVPLQGGIPIQHDGEVIGAIGVSGASSADEDNELAVIGAAAVATAADAASAAGNGAGADGAAFFPAARVEEKFADGGLLLDAGSYKIDAGRRREAGEAEYHADAVDVMRVVRGKARVVAGGELRDPREVAPGELRAPEVAGGETYELGEGDVLAIPKGVPHQFVEVSDPFLYYVVKVAG